MTPNPLIGVIYHWIGGFAAGSFYIPYKGVKKWSWETYWLVGGVFSWIIAPWFFATLLVPEVMTNLRAAGSHTLLPVYVFGALWGLGGLTFGLTMRYLGIALGMAVALGYCAAFGTLVPPIYHGNFHELLDNTPGLVILLGVLACLAGIAISGAAGMSKERELSPEQKVATVKEFDFKKGMLVATFSGIMSSCFAFGLDAGKPLAEITRTSLLAHGGSELWRNLPVLIVVMLGGFHHQFSVVRVPQLQEPLQPRIPQPAQLRCGRGERAGRRFAVQSARCSACGDSGGFRGGVTRRSGGTSDPRRTRAAVE